MFHHNNNQFERVCCRAFACLRLDCCIVRQDLDKNREAVYLYSLKELLDL